MLGKLLDRELVGVAKIDRPRELRACVHHPHKAFNQVIDIAKRTALLAIAVDRDRLPLQSLNDEVRHNASVVGVHAWTVGVEDPHDLDVEIVLAMIVKEQRLGAALSFIITSARTYRVDVTPVAFGLRVDRGVAVDLGGRGLHDPRLHPLGQSQHVDRADNADLGRLHWVELVVDRTRRAGEIVDLVYLDVERKADVLPHELKPRVADEVIEITLVAGEQVVDTKNFVAALEQAVDQVRAEESSPAGHEDAITSIV